VKWTNVDFNFVVEADRNSFTFSFSAPKMTIYGNFGHFRFRPKLF